MTKEVILLFIMLVLLGGLTNSLPPGEINFAPGDNNYTLNLTLEKKPVIIEKLGGSQIIQSDDLMPLGFNNPFDFADVSPVEASNLLSLMKDDLKVNAISESIFRKKVEVSPGVYDWAPVDELIDNYIVDNNMSLFLVITPRIKDCYVGDINSDDKEIVTVPSQGVNNCIPANTGGYASYTSYLRNLSAHIKSYPPSVYNKIELFEVWNEVAGDYKRGGNPQHYTDYFYEEYAELVNLTYNLIKSEFSVDVGLAGVGTKGTSLKMYEGVLPELNLLCPSNGCFDVFNYHYFTNKSQYSYGLNGSGFPLTYEYYSSFLLKHNFTNKKFFIKSGETHSGYDPIDTDEFQSEEDQATYAVKRAVTLISKDNILSVQWGTLLEHFCYKKSIHDVFTLGGLIYNGIPVQWQVPSCHTQNPDPGSYVTSNCDGQLPCSDPGYGVKKLGYFSYKLLIDRLRGSDWNTVQQVYGSDNVYVYKFDKQGEPIYVAWWDFYNDTGNNKTITIDLIEFPTSKALVTESVPNESNGDDINEGDYPNFFYSYISNLTTSAQYHHADEDNDFVINSSELNTYISYWKGNQSISLVNIIDAIGKWKAGSY